MEVLLGQWPARPVATVPTVTASLSRFKRSPPGWSGDPGPVPLVELLEHRRGAEVAEPVALVVRRTTRRREAQQPGAQPQPGPDRGDEPAGLAGHAERLAQRLVHQRDGHP